MTDVVFVNVRKRFALLTDDRIVPVTNLFDVVGDDTNDPDLAVAFVAGEGREWFAAAIADFQPRPAQ